MSTPETPTKSTATPTAPEYAKPTDGTPGASTPAAPERASTNATTASPHDNRMDLSPLRHAMPSSTAPPSFASGNVTVARDAAAAARFFYNTEMGLDNPKRFFNAPFPLFKLEDEIVNRVFAYVTASGKAIDVILTASAYANAKKNSKVPKLLPANLSDMGEKYAHEYKLAFYKSNTFKIYSVAACEWWMKRVSKEYRAAIIHVRLAYRVVDHKTATSAARMAVDLKSKFPKVQPEFQVEKDEVTTYETDPLSMFAEEDQDDEDDEETGVDD